MSSRRGRGRGPRPGRGSRTAGRHRPAVDRDVEDAILTGVPWPTQRITEGGIARRLGLSRTPVREALRVMATAALLVVVPQPGSFVSPLATERLTREHLDAAREHGGEPPSGPVPPRTAAQGLTPPMPSPGRGTAPRLAP